MFSPLHKVTLHHLPNGLPVYLKEDHQSPLLSAHAWIHVGSVDEEEVEAGISHILEHMVFKGTRHHKAEEISRWVEALGGAMNAETSKEYTHYYIDVPSEGSKQAVHLLAELLHRAEFDAQEWGRECQVILEEIKRRNDDPDTLLWDLLNEALFDDERRRRPVIGYPATVAAVTLKGLKSFYQTHYSASHIALVMVGDFDTKTMLGWIHNEFKDMPAGSAPVPRPQFSHVSAARAVEARKPVQQAYVAMGFPTPPSDHADQEGLDLLATVLGDGRGSRLVHQLREEKKLVWSISAANLTQEGPGIFAIFSECEPRKRDAVTREVRRLLSDLRRSPPKAAEIERAKNILQTAWLQGFETYHSQAATLGLFAIENQMDRLRSYLPRILSVTRAQLARIIHRYTPLPLASAVIEA